MEFLTEFIFEIFFEGGLEYGTSQKFPKWVRYIVLGLLSLFYLLIIGFLLICGILIIRENIWVALFLLGVGIYLLVASTFQLRKIYRKVAGKKNE